MTPFLYYNFLALWC